MGKKKNTKLSKEQLLEWKKRSIETAAKNGNASQVQKINSSFLKKARELSKMEEDEVKETKKTASKKK